MLTDRQLADIEADVTLVLATERIDPAMRQLARHARYLLDEVARLKGDTPCTNCGSTGPHHCQARDE